MQRRNVQRRNVLQPCEGEQVQALRAFVKAADWINEWAGRSTAWLMLFMVLIAFAVVVLRYVFALGWVWMQESFVWLHGAVFMLGAGYTLLHNGHVRVDIFYRGASHKFKAWVDIFGVLVLLTPMLLVVLYYSEGFVMRSWARLEGSAEAGGLPEYTEQASPVPTATWRGMLWFLVRQAWPSQDVRPGE